MILAAFLLHARCFRCAKTLTVTKTTPIRVNAFLAEGELFCIHSQLPYLTVVFSFSNLLTVRYSTNATSNPIHGAFTVPGKIGGIDFSDRIGSLEIESLLGGPVNFTLFAFPDECTGVRYVTNLDPDVFTFQDKFKTSLVEGPVCIWYTDRVFSLEASETVGARVCRGQTCESFHPRKQKWTNLDFFIVNNTDANFLSRAVFTFRSRKLKSPLKISEVLAPRDDPTLIELADRLWAGDIPEPPRQIFLRHDDDRVRRLRVHPDNDETVLYVALIVLIVIGTAATTLAAALYCMRQERAKGTIAGETESLISPNDPRRFPPYVYPYGYPVTGIPAMSGVYFPSTPAATNT